MTELMTTGRDSSFMIRNISFTKQVHFYICKIQIRPKLYPLSRNRNTVHHYYHIADKASVAPTHTKLNLSLWSASNKLLNSSSELNLQKIVLDLICQQMLKNFYSSYEQVRRNSERLLKWKLCPLYLSDRRVYLLYCLEPSVLASVADRKCARCTVLFAC